MALPNKTLGIYGGLCDGWRDSVVESSMRTGPILASVATKGILRPGVHVRLCNATDAELSYLCFNVLNLSFRDRFKSIFMDTTTVFEPKKAIVCSASSTISTSTAFASAPSTKMSEGVSRSDDPQTFLRENLLDESSKRLPPYMITESLKALVGECSTGALSVATERSGDLRWSTRASLVETLTNRVQSSVLILFNPRGALEERGNFIKPIFDPESSIITHHEVRADKSVPASEFYAVIAPLLLYREVRRIFPASVKVIPVEDKDQKVEILGPGFIPFPELSYRLEAPDYCEGLQEFVRSFDRNLFGTHVVRLPATTRVCLVFERARIESLRSALTETVGASYFELVELEGDRARLEIERAALEKELRKEGYKPFRVRHAIQLTLMRARFTTSHLPKLEVLQSDDALCLMKDPSESNMVFVYAKDNKAAARARAIYDSKVTATTVTSV